MMDRVYDFCCKAFLTGCALLLMTFQAKEAAASDNGFYIAFLVTGFIGGCIVIREVWRVRFVR